MNHLQTASAIAMIRELEKSNHKAPPRMASAIGMEVANSLKSKCDAFCKLAEATVMKLVNLQKQARQTNWLANANATSLQSARAIAM